MNIPALAAGCEPFISVEFFPPRSESMLDGFHETVEKLMRIRPVFAAVTCGAGGGGATGTLKTARDLIEQHGLTVMPHITCVQNSADNVKRLVAQIRECGIRNVLAVRGDFPEGYDPNAQELAHASDLVRLIRSVDADLNIGIAAYPDLHPESGDTEEELYYLRTKFDAGADFGVTQLFFDNRRYFDMVNRLAEKGCRKLIIPSVLPIRSLGQIKRLMQLCSTPIPGSLLARLEAAHDKGGDNAVREVGAEFAAEQLRGLIAGGAPGVHLYPFNRADLCLEVVERSGIIS